MIGFLDEARKKSAESKDLLAITQTRRALTSAAKASRVLSAGLTQDLPHSGAKLFEYFRRIYLAIQDLAGKIDSRE
jgi:hypothetical protein